MKDFLEYSTQYTTSTVCFRLDNLLELETFNRLNYSKAVYVMEEGIATLYENDFSSFQDKIVIDKIVELKSFQGMMYLLDRLILFELDRKSILVCIGGGELSDLVGFVASVYLRGITFGILPTTLLSMIDASIGGKNGINFLETKNQIGTIFQPTYIGFYYPFLRTLPKRELSSGFSEIIKYGLSINSDLLKLLESNSFDKFMIDIDYQLSIIKMCVDTKSQIVSRDSLESGERKILNFGHTLGHCFEMCYDLTHGEAIGLGMLMAIKISMLELKLEDSSFEIAKHILTKYGLPVRLSFDPHEVYKKLVGDKKRVKNEIEFVLLSKLGSAERRFISLEKVKSYLSLAIEEKWI